MLGLGELDLARTDVRALLVWIATQHSYEDEGVRRLLDCRREGSQWGAFNNKGTSRFRKRVKLGVEDLLETVSGLKAGLIQWGGK